MPPGTIPSFQINTLAHVINQNGEFPSPTLSIGFTSTCSNLVFLLAKIKMHGTPCDEAIDRVLELRFSDFSGDCLPVVTVRTTILDCDRISRR